MQHFMSYQISDNYFGLNTVKGAFGMAYRIS